MFFQKRLAVSISPDRRVVGPREPRRCTGNRRARRGRPRSAGRVRARQPGSRWLVEAEIMEDVVAVHRLELLGVELRILTAHVDEILGKRQITLLTGLFIQLGKGELDLRMTIGAVDLPSSGPKLASSSRPSFWRLQGPARCRSPDGRRRRLDVVTHHVHLVALLNQAEARAVGHTPDLIWYGVSK